MNFPVSVVCAESLLCCELPCDRRELAGLVRAMARAAQLLHGEGRLPLVPAAVVLELADDREMSRLNCQALSLCGPTNILSFPGDEGEEAELALCVPMLLRESLLYGQKPLRHLVRLVAHGLAHVCGLDHGEEMEFCQQKLEEAGLTFLGQTEGH